MEKEFNLSEKINNIIMLQTPLKDFTIKEQRDAIFKEVKKFIKRRLDFLDEKIKDTKRLDDDDMIDISNYRFHLEQIKSEFEEEAGEKLINSHPE